MRNNAEELEWIETGGKDDGRVPRENWKAQVGGVWRPKVNTGAVRPSCLVLLASARCKSGMWMCVRLSIATVFLMGSFTALAQQKAGTMPISEKVVADRTGPSIREVQKSAAIDPGYRIGPEDVIDISVWKERDLSRTLPVRPDGKISLPLLNDMQAAGLTPARLAEQITEGLKKFVTDPQVTVIVTEIRSQRIFILGEVTRPGSYSLLPGMTVLQALSSAGGFTLFANTKNIHVLRNENRSHAKYPFNYKEVIGGKAPEQNIALMSGDTIVVP